MFMLHITKRGNYTNAQRVFFCSLHVLLTKTRRTFGSVMISSPGIRKTKYLLYFQYLFLSCTQLMNSFLQIMSVN